jgi:hypothetical protein
VGTKGESHDVLHYFVRINLDRSKSLAGVVLGQDGSIFGITQAGRGAGSGSNFSSTYTVIRQLSGPDVRNPSGVPLAASNGTMYGSTLYGGLFDQSTVYKLGVEPFETVSAINARLAPDGFHATFSGAFQQTYSFESAANLGSNDGWKTRGMGSTDENGLVEFLDSGAANQLSLVYRASLPFK